jgi:hypothetical protein
MDLTERTAFGSREIADEMGTRAYPRVTGWIADLVDLGLLEIVGSRRSKAASSTARSTESRGKRFLMPQIARRRSISASSARAFSANHQDAMSSKPRWIYLLPIDHRHCYQRISVTVIDRSRWREGRKEGRRSCARAKTTAGRAGVSAFQHLPTPQATRERAAAAGAPGRPLARGVCSPAPLRPAPARRHGAGAQRADRRPRPVLGRARDPGGESLARYPIGQGDSVDARPLARHGQLRQRHAGL